MATTKKTGTEPGEPFAEGGLVGDGTPQTVEVKAGEVVLPAEAASELVSEQPVAYVNAGEVDLVLLQPPTVLKPGRVVELEYDPGHRDLRPATDGEIQASRDAEAAELEAKAQADTPAETTGQEQ